MSETQTSPSAPKSGGPRSDSRGSYGQRSDRPRSDRRGNFKKEEEIWVPRTELGKKVAAGLITTMDEIYANGLRIQEAGIIK